MPVDAVLKAVYGQTQKAMYEQYQHLLVVEEQIEQFIVTQLAALADARTGAALQQPPTEHADRPGEGARTRDAELLPQPSVRETLQESLLHSNGRTEEIKAKLQELSEKLQNLDYRFDMESQTWVERTDTSPSVTVTNSASELERGE